MKRLNLKIFPKTFVSSFTLIAGAVILAFVLLYAFLPSVYLSYKERQLERDIDELAALIADEDLDNVSEICTLFATQGDYSITLSDPESGFIFFSQGIGLGYMGISSVESIFTQEEYIIDSGDSKVEILDEDNVQNIRRERVFTRTITAETISLERIVSFENLRDLTLTLGASIQPINEASTVILTMLPYILLICLVLAATVSFFYAKTITGPIKTISDATVAMSALESSAKCDVETKDEIGELAGRINELYGRLLSTITDLQAELQNAASAEKEKIDFMLTVSHELKTPLTSVKGMLEGMIGKVGVYKDRDEYLCRCLADIDALSSLLSEMLGASKLELSVAAGDAVETNIKQLVSNTAATFEIIALSRHVSIELDVEEDLSVHIPADLLEKALSNIISNAVNYSNEGSVVRIYTQTGRAVRGLPVAVPRHPLLIENTCEPLSAQEAERAFEPFYKCGSDGGRENSGHGLGLYLTERILKVCGLEYEFASYEEGMRFTIWL